MTGLVLAAGFGTRLKPLTDHVPKALVPVGGRPLLSRCLDALAKNGVGPLCVNSHHGHELMLQFAGRSPVRFELFHEQPRIRGTGGALAHARDFLARDGFFAVWNVDILCQPDLRPVIDAFVRSGDECALLAAPPKQTGRGTVAYDPPTRLFLGTRPDECGGAAAWGDFIGVTLYRRSFLDQITDDDFSIVPVWKRAAAQGRRVTVVILPGLHWRDCGTPQELAAAHTDIVDGLLDLPVPEWMTVDRAGRRAWRSVLPTEQTVGIGAGCWIEAGGIPTGCTFRDAVVFGDAHLEPGRAYPNCLVTPWGEIPCRR